MSTIRVDVDSFKLFVRMAKPKSAKPSGLLSIRSWKYSRVNPCTLWRVSCSTRSTSASRIPEIGVSPGVFLASARTNERARLTASTARPDQSDAHTICEYGCIVRANISENGVGRTCSALPREVTMNPELHVPRKPIVSQPEIG